MDNYLARKMSHIWILTIGPCVLFILVLDYQCLLYDLDYPYVISKC
uniref:Uncharacterized protein n=1 Tax=Arundo donax TaxID=35708 RepID=A0A0A9FKH9_ARUDO